MNTCYIKLEKSRFVFCMYKMDDGSLFVLYTKI